MIRNRHFKQKFFSEYQYHLSNTSIVVTKNHFNQSQIRSSIPRTINDLQDNQFGRLFLGLSFIEIILEYLDADDLNNLHSYCLTSQVTSEKLDVAAEGAFNKTVNDNANERQVILQNKEFFGSSPELLSIIDQRNSHNLIRYQQVKYGPSTPVLFNVFAGKSLLGPNEQEKSNIYSNYPMGDSIGIATMNNPILSQGKHYLSCTFQNAGGSNNFISYEIGVMRPLMQTGWNRILRGALGVYLRENGTRYNYFRNRFVLSHDNTMTRMNRMRCDSWIGNIDCCVFNPRGKIGSPSLNTAGLNNEALWPYVHKAYWYSPTDTRYTNKQFTNEWITGVDSRGQEHIELLLDLDTGTLSYCKNGLKEKTIGEGLQGLYVWVIGIFGKTIARRQFKFQCKTY